MLIISGWLACPPLYRRAHFGATPKARLHTSFTPGAPVRPIQANSVINPVSSPLLLFLLSLLILWATARLGARFSKRGQEVREDLGVILTATLTLLGLIVGFTFSMAVSRYEQRKLYEEEEANAIGTEYLRADLLPPADAENIRNLLRQYIDQRISFYHARDEEALPAIDDATSLLQARLWTATKGPAAAQPTPLSALVTSGMNDVLNSQGYTQAAWRNQIPFEAWILMAVIAIFGNFMVGLDLLRVSSNAALLAVLPIIVALSFLLISDMDAPRRGLIHVTAVNLISTRQSMR
jgi:hypothetical protein